MVPLNATARACVEKMLKFNRSRGFSTASEAPLFQNRKHRVLSIRSVQKLIEEYRKKADLDVKATPHTLRHTNATALQNAGVPTRVIQQGLGHRHLSTTERYLGISTMESSLFGLGWLAAPASWSISTRLTNSLHPPAKSPAWVHQAAV